MYPDGCKTAILRGVQGQTNDDDRYNGFLDKAGKVVDLIAETACKLGDRPRLYGCTKYYSGKSRFASCIL